MCIVKKMNAVLFSVFFVLLIKQLFFSRIYIGLMRLLEQKCKCCPLNFLIFVLPRSSETHFASPGVPLDASGIRNQPLVDEARLMKM